MLQKTLNILISVLLSVLIVFGVGFYVFNYLPFGTLIKINAPTFGTALTDLNSSDTMSDFPTLYNANNLILYNEKIGVTTTTLPLITTLVNLSSVGTITTGTWNATAISVSKGGTGTTSPSQYLVILGNGAAGFTVASSTGTSGMSLVSNGPGAYPSWQSVGVNQADNYLWTGEHFFSASTTLPGNSSEKLTINTLSYVWPTSQQASSTLATDGSGNLSWSQTNRLLYASTADVTITNSNSSTTLCSFSVPANALGTNRIVHYKISFDYLRIYAATRTLYFQLTFGTQSPTYGTITASADQTEKDGYFEGYIYANGTNSQEHSVYGIGFPVGGGQMLTEYFGFASSTAPTTVDSTSAQTLSFIARFETADTFNKINVRNCHAELLGY